MTPLEALRDALARVARLQEALVDGDRDFVEDALAGLGRDLEAAVRDAETMVALEAQP